MSGLLGPNGQPISTYKKAPAPKTGEAFGQWAGRDVQYMQMPGGGLIGFDLSRLQVQDFRTMRDHYQVNSSLAVLSFMQHQSEWHIECENKKIAKFCEDQLRDQWTPLNRSLATANWSGYCVTPETPILCSDMMWRKADELAVGQEILAFDEEKPDVDDRDVTDRRRYRTAVIERNERATKPCWWIYTDTGQAVTASEDHPWLVWRKDGRKSGYKTWPGLCWVQTKDLYEGDQIAFFGKPWVREETREAGWLAGMFDGEGWLSRHVEKNRLVPSWKLGIAQNPGVVLNKIKRALIERGFKFREQTTSTGCVQLFVTGGWHETLRFLGTVGPERLCEKLPKMLADQPAMYKDRNFTLATIEAMSPEGNLEVASITTSSGTFITGGYLSHNSPNVLQWENNLDNRTVDLDKIKDMYPEECSVVWEEKEGWAPPGKMKPKFKVYDGFKQFGAPYPVPVENSLWYPLLMENGDYYGRKLLRAAFIPWYFSILVHLFANRYYERFGEPVPVGRASFEDEVQSEDGKMVRGNKYMLSVLEQLRNRSVVVLPNDATDFGNGRREYDYDIEYLESQMRGADFERYLTRLDEEISIGLFTPILLLRTADVGSYNLGVGHMQMYLWMLNAMNNDRAFYIDKYLLSRLTDYNFSTKAPRPKIKFRKLGNQNGELLRSLITELTKQGSIKPDIRELGEMAGMTFKEVEGTVDKTSPSTDTSTDTGASEGDGVPNGTDKARETEKTITARVAPQVINAFKAGTFGPEFKLNMGYKKRMTESLGVEAADQVYTHMDAWISEAVCTTSSPDEFMNMFSKVLAYEVDAAASV